MMILFFGIRPGKTISIDLKQLKCPHCNQNDTLTGESTPNFFHLFWIPIFRVTTTQAVHCSHCKKVYYKEEFTKEMKAAF